MPIDPPTSVFTPPSGSAPAAPGAVFALSPAQVARRAAAAMCQAVDARLAGVSAAAGMKLFTGLTGSYSGSSFTPNSACWMQGLRSQLTGIHMRAGGYTQSYALQMITPRHAISCGHNGPTRADTPLYYVKADGTVHSNSILKWANDYPDSNAGGWIDSYDYPAETDLSVYLLTSAVPEWIHKAPLIRLTDADRLEMAPYDPPTVAISQGSWSGGPASPYGYADTPDNRMAYTKQLDLGGLPAHREPFYHTAVTGDSGTPEFILLNGTLYLYRIITGGGAGTGPLVGDHVDYINELIGRCDAAAGISTGYTVTAKILSEI